MAKRGVLLVNVGTPDAPEVPAVRRYLREFLSDPRVIDLPAVARKLLLELFILPFRPRTSTEAYRKVWTAEGSPVLVIGQAFTRALAERLGDDVQVELAMRYQSPSIVSALERFERNATDHITVFPLFPQYSSAATGTAVERVWELAGARWNVPCLDFVGAFYDHPAFIEAWAAVARGHLEQARADRVLMSFHGLPERHVLKSDSTQGGHCLASEECCDRIVQANRFCYRAQCMATARAVASALGLEDAAWEVTFQSRLGRTPWIRPHTDVRLRELAAEGVQRVAVLCPAFVADCLETLEEIAIRGREDFVAHGGEDLVLVPSLNDDPAWVDAAARLLGEHWAGGAQREALREPPASKEARA